MRDGHSQDDSCQRECEEICDNNDVWDHTLLNHLFDTECWIETHNKLMEDIIEEFVNPLFDGPDKNYLLPEGWVDKQSATKEERCSICLLYPRSVNKCQTKRVYDRIQLYSKMKDSMDFRWAVGPLLNFIYDEADYHFTREDAQVFLHQFVTLEFCKSLTPLIVPDPYKVDSYDLYPSDTLFYRPYDEDIKKYHHYDVLNVRVRNKSGLMDNIPIPVPVRPSHRSSIYRLGRTLSKAVIKFDSSSNSESLRDSFNAEKEFFVKKLYKDLAPKPQSEIIKEMEEVLEVVFRKGIAYEGDSPMNKGYIDYNSLFISEEFNELVRVAESLRLMDVTAFSQSEAISFYCNVYNMMSIHALLLRECEPKQSKRERFAEKYFYFVGRHKLSMNDIYHRILRGADIGHKYYLLDYQIPGWNAVHGGSFDPRIHFVLHNGCNTSPVPRVLTVEKLDSTLENATKAFVNSQVIINESQNKIGLPSLFLIYKQELCGSNSLREIWKYVSRYLTPPKLKIASNILQRISEYDAIYFIDDDYNLNKKPVKLRGERIHLEKAKENFTMDFTLENPDLRAYFKTFSAFEASAENVQFAESVLEFKKLSSTADRKEKASKIIKDVFGPMMLATSSTAEITSSINLELNVNKKDAVQAIVNYHVQSREGTMRSDIFDKLYAEVCSNMVDTYTRFVKTDIFTTMVENFMIDQMNKEYKTQFEAIADLVQHKEEKISQVTNSQAPRKVRINREKSFRVKSPPTPETAGPNLTLAPQVASRVSNKLKDRISSLATTKDTMQTPTTSTAKEAGVDNLISRFNELSTETKPVVKPVITKRVSPAILNKMKMYDAK